MLLSQKMLYFNVFLPFVVRKNFIFFQEMFIATSIIYGYLLYFSCSHSMWEFSSNPRQWLLAEREMREVVLTPRRHLAVPGDIFGCHIWGLGGASVVAESRMMLNVL